MPTSKNKNSSRRAAERNGNKKIKDVLIDLIVAPSITTKQSNLNINVKVAGGAA